MFACKVCDKVFKTGSSLSSHKYRYHAKKVNRKETIIITIKTSSDKSMKKRGEQTNGLQVQSNFIKIVKYQQLIKSLSKALLDGSLLMTSTQVNQLKPHGDLVRELADGSVEEVATVLEDVSNKKILKLLFDTISYIFNNIF